MGSGEGERLPIARTAGLLIERVGDETLIYDLDRQEAHCLNTAAAFVWRHCDGRTTHVEMARLLARELGLPAGSGIVRLALADLEGAKLLEAPVTTGPSVSRRRLLQGMGPAAAAALLPLVESIIAPEAAAAASCIGNDECVRRDPQACGGTRICHPSRLLCCTRVGSRCNAMPC